MRITVAGDGVLAVLLAGGDDQPGGDVAQAQLLAAEVQGDGEHGVVGDGGAADRLAAGTGRLVAVQGERDKSGEATPRERREPRGICPALLHTKPYQAHLSGGSAIRAALIGDGRLRGKFARAAG
jgi:hypothetical protein